MWKKHVPLCLTLLLMTAIGTTMAVVPSALVAQTPSDADTEEWQALGRRPGEGEQCLVCRQRIHGDEVVEIRYKGRRFFVAAKMIDAFEDDPDTYFRALQARSAWFDERTHEGRQVAWGWVAIGCYVLIGLVCAAICGFLAIRRSLAPLPWFFAGLAGNVVALVFLLISPRGDPASVSAASHAPVPCPACGAGNHPSSSECGRCQAALVPTVESEVTGTIAPAGGAS